MQEKVNELRWSKTLISSDGFICLVDCMGTDADVVNSARVSYDADDRDTQDRLLKQLNKMYPDVNAGYITDYTKEQIECAEFTCKVSDDVLLRYLMRHRHTTPSGMPVLRFLVRAPVHVFRQWHRHRTQNYNEYSMRYTTAIDSMETTPADEWRLQSDTNKQGSSGFLREWPDWPDGTKCPQEEGDPTPGQYLSAKEADFHKIARELYEERLKFGVAKEQARKDLPLSNYSEMYAQTDLHNWFHFLGLRADSHAQKEIRDYADAIADIIKELFPVSYQAWLDYRFNAISLSALDTVVIQTCSRALFKPTEEHFDGILRTLIANKREAEECKAKCIKLNVFTVLKRD